MAQSTPAPSPWSPWGGRLVAVLLIGLGVCLVWAWIAVVYLWLPLNVFLSWRSFELPSMPMPSSSAPIIGLHFFGDFQEARWWGIDILQGRTPYRGVNIYGPVAPWLMVPFALLPLQAAFGVYAIATAVALILPVWLLLRGVPTDARIVATIALTVLTAPFLATLDRGNLQGIVIGLTGLGLVMLQRSRMRWAVALFALAIAIKPFMLVVIVVALALRRARFALATVASVAVVSFVALSLMPGGPQENIPRAILSQFLATSGPDLAIPERLLANASLAGLVTTLSGSTPPVLLIAGAWLLLVFVVTWRRRVPQWAWGAVALASIQVAQPFGATYTMSWAALAGAWFGLGLLLPAMDIGPDRGRLGSRTETTLRVLVLATIAASLLPLAARPTVLDTTVGLLQTLSPALILVTGLFTLAVSVWPRRHPATADTPEHSSAAD